MVLTPVMSILVDNYYHLHIGIQCAKTESMLILTKSNDQSLCIMHYASNATKEKITITRTKQKPDQRQITRYSPSVETQEQGLGDPGCG